MSLLPTSPIDDFENLTIDTKMSPTSTEIRSRALEVRDVLSSFDRNILPAEFKPHVFSELDRPFQTRPPQVQWTIQEDLSATLLHWGAYNDQAYELLTSLQSSSTLARCFYEKLSRRFAELFAQYDDLSQESQSTIRNEIQRIARDFRKLVAAVEEDCQYREQGQEATARTLLEGMIEICRRHAELVPSLASPVTPRRSTRRTNSSTEGPTSLYEALVQNPIDESTTGEFMLDVLETFPGNIYTNLEAEHSRLVSLLNINKAPTTFKYRIGRLPSRTGASDTDREVSQPPARAAQPRARIQTQTQGQASNTSKTATGAKRVAEDTSPIARRGKKKAALE